MKDNADIKAAEEKRSQNGSENPETSDHSDNQKNSERRKEKRISGGHITAEPEDSVSQNQNDMNNPNKTEQNFKNAGTEPSAIETFLTGAPAPSDTSTKSDNDPVALSAEGSTAESSIRKRKEGENRNATGKGKKGSKSAAESDSGRTVKKQKNTSEKLKMQTGKIQDGVLHESKTADEAAASESGSGMKSSGSGRKNYSTAYTVYRTKIYTSDVIKYFQKKTFSVINNCLFNLCMVRPIHMEDTQYDQLYHNLCMIFNNTEKQIESARQKFSSLFSEKGGKTPDIYYTSPLETDLQLKTPMSLRYVKILENLDLLLQTIDRAHNAGFIVNPRDAVKLKYQWTRQIFMFTSEIRDLDNGRITRADEVEK
jgi:hypothetical protein